MPAPITYTMSVRRYVEEIITVTVEAPSVEDAEQSALTSAREGFGPEVGVTVEVVGNIHGSDGTLWI